MHDQGDAIQIYNNLKLSCQSPIALILIASSSQNWHNLKSGRLDQSSDMDARLQFAWEFATREPR